jgi:hypothetical protein
MQITLRAANGRYVCAEGGGGIDSRIGGAIAVRADRADAGPWETFTVYPLDEGRIALETCNGFYLTAEGGGGGALRTDARAIGPWESFAVVGFPGAPDEIALQTWDRVHVLCAEIGSLDPVVNATRTGIGEWERFARGFLEPPGPTPAPLAGRLRCADGRFVNDAGPVHVRGISEFSFVHLARTGREAELIRRRDRASGTGGRNLARVFARAVNLFDLDARQAGYLDAVDRALTLNAEAGMYTELVVGVDAHGLTAAERRAFLVALLDAFGGRPEVLWQLSNEPWQNGWSGTDDPELLALAELTASILGHRDFSIGDPRDGDTVDASAATVEAAARLAQYCNVIPIHSSRKGGATSEPDRWRRWIDHLEGFFDIVEAARRLNPDVVGVHGEPMGHASQQWVPLANGRTYEREYDPEVALAAAATSAAIGVPYVYHYISEQDDGTPGLDLLGRYLSDVPVGPGWRYQNDSWPDAATRGFTWTGGKVRTWTNGARALVLAYGLTKGELTWANGFQPVAPVRYDGARVQLINAIR